MWYIERPSAKIVVWDSKNQKVSIGSIVDILDEKRNPGSASEIVLVSQSSGVKCTYVYN